MTGVTPNPATRSNISVAFSASPVVHPDYTYWAPMWEMIRDAEIGECEIKRKRERYLPRLQGHNQQQYDAYLARSVFYNMTAKTLNALYGTVFRRAPKVSGFTPALTRASRRFSKDGMSLHLTAKTLVKELLAVGRFGMLVDSTPDGRGGAYVACYTTENILDWRMEEIDGEWTYVRVVLREIEYSRENIFAPYDYTARYRVLVLTETPDGPVYEQHIYRERETRGIPTTDTTPDEIVIPTVRGRVLDRIPFIIVGPFTNHAGVQKPPILDIVTLNMSHYKSYAQLEQGRFYTANPVYWTKTAQSNSESGAAEYFVGPDVVWELGNKDAAAGILEFQGAGLRFLESALETKETQIAAIGGRMMPGTSRAAAESDNSLRLKEQNEQTLLLNIVDTSDEAMTQVCRWWADWNNTAPATVERITFELNRDFLLKDVGAREFRAIHMMYADGVIPIDVLYDYLRKSEVIPEWMGLDEYKRLVADSNSYPNMVDVLARMSNFPDAKTFFEYWKERRGFVEGSMDVLPNPGESGPQPIRQPQPALPPIAKDNSEVEAPEIPE